MKKVLLIVIVLLTSPLLYSCKNYDNTINEDRGSSMNSSDIYEFSFIDKAPEATERHSLKNVVKVLFEKTTVP